MKYTGITNQDRLEATEGRRSKPSFLQMTSMLTGFGYFLFCKYADRILAEVHTRDIVFGVFTAVMVILVIVLGLYTRKRKDAEYSWSLWVLVIVFCGVGCIDYFPVYLD